MKFIFVIMNNRKSFGKEKVLQDLIWMFTFPNPKLFLTVNTSQMMMAMKTMMMQVKQLSVCIKFPVSMENTFSVTIQIEILTMLKLEKSHLKSKVLSVWPPASSIYLIKQESSKSTPKSLLSMSSKCSSKPIPNDDQTQVTEQEK